MSFLQGSARVSKRPNSIMYLDSSMRSPSISVFAERFFPKVDVGDVFHWGGNGMLERLLHFYSLIVEGQYERYPFPTELRRIHYDSKSYVTD